MVSGNIWDFRLEVQVWDEHWRAMWCRWQWSITNGYGSLAGNSDHE